LTLEAVMTISRMAIETVIAVSAPILLAGYAAGMALVAMACTAVALLARSINQIVY